MLALKQHLVAVLRGRAWNGMIQINTPPLRSVNDLSDAPCTFLNRQGHADEALSNSRLGIIGSNLDTSPG
jgi:hypothetical protein